MATSCLATQPATEVRQAAEYESTEATELAEQVTVRRTTHGVPHILAENIRAAGYALGYVQMEDYGERVINQFVRARGEWARYNEVEGRELETRLDIDAAARRDYARAVETYHLLEKDTRQILEGFAVGVNRYIEQHPDEFEEWLEPNFTGYDVHAQGVSGVSRGAIRSFLSRFEEQKNRENERTSTVNRGSSLSLDEYPTIWARLAQHAEIPHPDVGSNAWAFSPDRTESGNAILVRNPHLSWDAGYYEGQMEIPGVFNFYGDFRMGGPLGIIGGFNQYLGWSTTNNGPDLDEVYAFEADPDKPDHYLLDGASLPVERETVEVEFKNGESLALATREFLSTPFGPVIHRAEGKIYVMKAAGDGEYRMGEQFLKMMKAQNLEEWKEAMRTRGRTSSNLTYADVEGNIFYVWNASIPDLPHASGGDSLAVPVTTTDDIWTKLIDWDDLPQLLNPVGGYLRNENDPFHYTNLNEVFDEDDFPEYFPEPTLRLRSQLSVELVHNTDKFSLEDVVKLKNNMKMLLADRVKEDLIDAVRSENPEGEVAEALKQIEEWDNTVARDSRGGLLFKTWWSRYVETADTTKRVRPTPESSGFAAEPEKLFTEPWSPENPAETPYGLADKERAAEAFVWAIAEAKKEYGAWDLPWGDVHRARIGDQDLAVGGCTGMLGCFRVLWYREHEEDEQKLEVRGGDGWVFAVEFDEIPKAYSVLAYGQSGKEDSPFYGDQLEMFVNEEMKPVAYTEEDIEDQLLEEYRPGE